jgi:CheY-like chemotaxis protein
MIDFELDLLKLSVLIVDDHNQIRQILRDILRGFGIRKLHQAENGKEGMQVFENVLPNLVFTDMNMAPMNGLEFSRAIRKNVECRCSEIPIIMLTGNRDHSSIIQARDAGVSELLVKPVAPRMVMDRLRTAMYERRPFVRSTNYIGPCRRRKKDQKQKNPFRRISDTIQIKTANTDSKKLVTEIGAESEALSLIITKLGLGERRVLNTTFSRSRELRELAAYTGNPYLEAATHSLMDQIEKSGANGNLSASSIQLHLNAIAKLCQNENHRDGVPEAIILQLKNQAVGRAG